MNRLIKTVFGGVVRPSMESSLHVVKVKEVVVTDFHPGVRDPITVTAALAAVYIPSMSVSAFWVVGTLQPGGVLVNEIYFTTKEKALTFMAQLMIGADEAFMEAAERNDRDLRMTWTQNGHHFPEQITLK